MFRQLAGAACRTIRRSIPRSSAPPVAAATPKYKFAVICAAKWETDWINEWVSYYRLIGFEHAYIYCNDDDPRELYSELLPFTQGSDPFVTFYHHGIQGAQEQMFLHFLKNHVQECEWFAFIDADEFILLRHHDTIGEFIDTLDSPDAVHFFTLNAGNNGHVERPRGLAIKLFNRRARTVHGFTKVVGRTSAYDPDRLDSALGHGWWHDIARIMRRGSRMINVLGMDMTHFYEDINKNWGEMHSEDLQRKVIDTACIYHIQMKSEGDMIRRLQRGVGGDLASQQVWQTFLDRGPEAVREYLAPQNEVEETRLIEVWERLEAKAFIGQLGSPPPGKNIAINCEASQSSLSEWSRNRESVEQDAGNVVNGKPTGLHHHHTALEVDPWWQVKLRDVAAIQEIRVFNRMDGSRDRLRNIVLKGSLDGETWDVLHEKRDDKPFGGVDGRFFCWRPDQPVRTRYIRIVGVGECFLDLDQVEIFE